MGNFRKQNNFRIYFFNILHQALIRILIMVYFFARFLTTQ